MVAAGLPPSLPDSFLGAGQPRLTQWGQAFVWLQGHPLDPGVWKEEREQEEREERGEGEMGGGGREEGEGQPTTS